MLVLPGDGYVPGMRAITVILEKVDSLELSQVPDPGEQEGEVLVDVVGVGVCGTDAEIIEGRYGQAPPGRNRLVLGHESLAGSGRRPPARRSPKAISWCASCAAPTRCRA